MLKNPNLKIFPSKKISYIFQKKYTLKHFLHFGKSNFLAPRLEDLLYFLKKGFLIFQEMELSSSKFKKLSYFFLKTIFHMFQGEL